jgi:N-acetylmuramoyl-L-alanine amidase
MPFTLQDHSLGGTSAGGDAVHLLASPNHGDTIRPRYLVFHYTASSAASAEAQFMTSTVDKRSSAHLLVHPNGSVTQFVALNLRAWHAGISRWGGLTDLNSHAIGIEVANWGYLLKSADGTFRSWTGALVSPQEVVEARHKHPQVPYRYWHAYTPEQVETCAALAELLVTHYDLEDVLGHDDIAPDRKQDPGPAFPLLSVRGRAVGRDVAESADEVVYVGAAWLNVRRGPGASYPLADNALPAGTQLAVLERRTGWLRVRTPSGVNGWVCEPYTADQPAQQASTFA